jgi:hypothetical protein
MPVRNPSFHLEHHPLPVPARSTSFLRHNALSVPACFPKDMPMDILFDGADCLIKMPEFAH